MMLKHILMNGRKKIIYLRNIVEVFKNIQNGSIIKANIKPNK